MFGCVHTPHRLPKIVWAIQLICEGEMWLSALSALLTPTSGLNTKTKPHGPHFSFPPRPSPSRWVSYRSGTFLDGVPSFKTGWCSPHHCHSFLYLSHYISTQTAKEAPANHTALHPTPLPRIHVNPSPPSRGVPPVTPPSQEGRMTCLPWNKSMMSIVGHASLLLTLEATKFKKNSWSNQQYIYLSILTKNLYNLVGKNEPLTNAICYKAISNEIQFATFSKVGKLFHSNNHNWTDQPQHPSCSFSTLTRITKSTSSCSKWASD